MAAGENHESEVNNTKEISNVGDNSSKDQADLNWFSVDILHVVKDAQAQHGLRHGDYHRYHGYCSRRLKRIRSCLKFRMGDKRRVTPRHVTQNTFTDAKFILMILMTAERAWSMAMYLKPEADAESRKRHHMMEKLRKAVKHAEHLHKLCNGCAKVDVRTKLEAQAYCTYMNGILMFESKSWVQAMEKFNQTQTIYKKLSEAMSKEEQPVYLNMVEEISPNIRYCAYTIGDQSAMDDLLQMHGSSRQDPLLAGKLDSLIAESRGSKAATMSELTWRGHLIRVKNTKVRLLLIGIKEFEEGLSSLEPNDRDGQIEAYDLVLTECKDALQLTKDDMRTDLHSKSGKKGSVSDLQLLHSYLSFLRLIKTVHRNLLLVDDLKEKSPASLLIDGNAGGAATSAPSKKVPKPTDYMRLYDSIIQSLMEVVNLPGIVEDRDLQDELSTQKTALQAIRSFYIAQVYVNEKKWAEAMALYDRVSERAKEALQAMNVLGKCKEFDFVESSLLESLVETIAFNRYRVHSSAVLDGVKKSDDTASPDVDRSVPMLERLNLYYEDPAVSSLSSGKSNQKAPQFTSSFPPSFEPVPCKPVFFDLALYHHNFPSLEAKLGQKQSQQKAGLSGLISNLWGWGGKK